MITTDAGSSGAGGLGIKDGLEFSVGLLDHALIYCFLCRFVIRRWSLRTPGREKEGEESAAMADTSA